MEVLRLLHGPPSPQQLTTPWSSASGLDWIVSGTPTAHYTEGTPLFGRHHPFVRALLVRAI